MRHRETLNSLVDSGHVKRLAYKPGAPQDFYRLTAKGESALHA